MTMYVGVCSVSLHIYESRSLKDRRRVVKSLTDRLQRKFGVSVADVGGQDTWQIATLGITTVSGDHSMAQKQLDRVIEFIYETVTDAEVTATDTDIFDY